MDASTPAGVLAVGAGVVLIYSGFTGQNPLTELRTVLSTGRTSGGANRRPLDIGAWSGTGVGALIDGASVGGGSTSLAPATQTVDIGGGHRLRPDAAIAFRKVEQTLRRAIPLSGSTRSYADQAANYAREPGRFGPPDNNAHVAGIAVDVNLPALGIVRGTDDEPAYAALVSAFESNGWCNFQRNSGGTGGRNIREPWHWSFKVCR